jgi:hypothetical protein
MVLRSIPFYLFLLPHMRTGAELFQDYGEPDTDLAVIDLDQRSIVAQTALASAEGLRQAKSVYEQGRVRNSTKTLQSLSTDQIYPSGDTFQTFQIFYGGVSDFADLWMQAAFDETSIIFGTKAPKAVMFNDWTVEGRSSAVRWGAVVLHIWMAVASYLEKSLAALRVHCSNGDRQAQENAKEAWDDAFSLYTGSLAEAEATGYLLYNFAEIQCQSFGTCRKGEESPVNTEIVHNFVLGKQHIQDGKEDMCAMLQQNVERIQALLKVPIIQASLKSLYAIDMEDDQRPEIQGEAAAYSAALAPVLSACSSGSADIIYNDMFPNGLSKNTGSFEVVKSALERNYLCLGVTCQNVGGIITVRGDHYLDRAEACDGVLPVAGAGVGSAAMDTANGGINSKQNTQNSANVGLAVGLTATLVLVFMIVAVLASKKRPGKKEEYHKNPPAPVIEAELT